MSKIVIGQRWLSMMEPELGLGVVRHFDNRTICLHFPAADCAREYSLTSAPIQRIVFTENDTIKTVRGESFFVDKVEDKKGFLTYCSEKVRIPENQLCHTLVFDGTESRLLRGFVDSNSLFNTRYDATVNKCAYQKSIYRGFIGGRISLLFHQLYVANEIANKRNICALLADETGLGKTIEASLILHRLLLCGRVARVLIITPQPLVYQWFVELLRKFNLVFQVVDKKFLSEFHQVETKTNPFLGDQLFLSWFELLFESDTMKQSLLESEWDLIIVDEAHHILHESKEYFLLKKLRSKAKGMLLLTATPDQLGHKSHFSRLQLLDPDRYFDFKEFQKEEEQYVTIADFINRLLFKKSFQGLELQKLMETLPGEFGFFKNEVLRNNNGEDIFHRDTIVEETLDLFGTGRNVFRNTRKTIKGFPKRFAHLISLKGSPQIRERLKREFENDSAPGGSKKYHEYNDDPRIDWLKKLLTKNKKEKYLLICSSLGKASAIEENLTPTLRARTTLFHERLSLLRRDQNAAWFASEEDGAQLMLCSEIGSEGRNFQFAHNLILFDVPLNPELLEQRIGRLDRIGQRENIEIHIPFVEGTPQEFVARWYHEGLNLFCENINSSHILYEKLGPKLLETLRHGDHQVFLQLIQETQELLKKMSHQFEMGRDRLLELNSFRPEKVVEVIELIHKEEKDQNLQCFLFEIFEQFGIQVSDLTDKTFKVEVDLLTSTEFPLPFGKPQGFVGTFDRETAITHEHIEFLTWDHPMVSGVMELILGSEKGSASYAFWSDKKKTELLLESVFIAECVSPGELYMDRFFPQTPLRIVVNQELKDCTQTHTLERIKSFLTDKSHLSIMESPAVKNELIPAMIKKSKEIAEFSLQSMVTEISVAMKESLGSDINRLKKLREMNPLMPSQDQIALTGELEALQDSISSARVRIDAMRLILRGEEI